MKLSMRRRYEVWFLRLGLADGSGAWWFRYLLLNPGRGGCAQNPQGYPAQVRRLGFREGKPQTWIGGFPLNELRLSRRNAGPFLLEMGENRISENECHGALEIDGRLNQLDLRHPVVVPRESEQHGLDRLFRARPIPMCSWGATYSLWPCVSGCIVWYRNAGSQLWISPSQFLESAHLHFPGAANGGSTFEALVDEMPRLFFHRAVLWHNGQIYAFRSFAKMYAIHAN